MGSTLNVLWSGCCLFKQLKVSVQFTEVIYLLFLIMGSDDKSLLCMNIESWFH